VHRDVALVIALVFVIALAFNKGYTFYSLATVEPIVGAIWCPIPLLLVEEQLVVTHRNTIDSTHTIIELTIATLIPIFLAFIFIVFS